MPDPAANSSSAPDTPRRILDAAERLFAARGYAEVSLRGIIREAGVNLASVHYHFGSKEALFRTLLSRRIEPLNAERLARLDAVERRARGRAPRLEAVLDALLGPALRLSRDTTRGGVLFMNLAARTFSDPDERLQSMLLEHFKGVAARFIPVLRAAVPGLPSREFFWRIHFIIGAMAHTMAHTRHLEFISRGQCDPGDTEGIIRRLVAFASAGLRTRATARGKANGKGRKK